VAACTVICTTTDCRLSRTVISVLPTAFASTSILFPLRLTLAMSRLGRLMETRPFALLRLNTPVWPGISSKLPGETVRPVPGLAGGLAPAAVTCTVT
jgi:hypothetical protein